MASSMPPQCWQGMDRPKAEDKAWNQPGQVNNLKPLSHGPNAKGISARCPETPRLVPDAAIKLYLRTTSGNDLSMN